MAVPDFRFPHRSEQRYNFLVTFQWRGIALNVNTYVHIFNQINKQSVNPLSIISRLTIYWKSASVNLTTHYWSLCISLGLKSTPFLWWWVKHIRLTHWYIWDVALISSFTSFHKVSGAISCKISFSCMPRNLIDDKSILAKLMVWCIDQRHHRTQCRPRDMGLKLVVALDDKCPED